MLFCERRLNGEAGAVQAAFKNVKLAAESRSSIEIYVKILVCQSTSCICQIILAKKPATQMSVTG